MGSQRISSFLSLVPPSTQKKNKHKKQGPTVEHRKLYLVIYLLCLAIAYNGRIRHRYKIYQLAVHLETNTALS